MVQHLGLRGHGSIGVDFFAWIFGGLHRGFVALQGDVSKKDVSAGFRC